MKYSNQSYNLRIELDTKGCELSADEIAKMEQALGPLHSVTESFPISDLYVTVTQHGTTGDYHVKTALVLSGQTLFTGERTRDRYGGYQQCLDKLLKKVAAYKDQLANKPEHARIAGGTAQEIVPSQVPDGDAINLALETRDYADFRRALLPYEEPVRKRIGRWIQRYPALNAEIGIRLTLSDVVEDVFLTAFERADQRPLEMHPGEWLENLIDDVIRSIAHDPEGELRNVSMVRSALAAED